MDVKIAVVDSFQISTSPFFSDFYFWNRRKIVHESFRNRKKKSVPKRKKKTVPPAGWRLAGGGRHILLKETPGVATVKIVLKTY